MPKGVQNANPERLERLRAKVAQSLAFSLSTNKNFDFLSNFIFERTGAVISNSTLRRVFQYNSDNHPTKSTLDLICKSIGFQDWADFIAKERNHSQLDLSQLITLFKLQGIGNHEQTWKILDELSDHPNIFNLLNTVVQIAISNRDILFLSRIFELDKIFDQKRYPVPIIYFVHGLVISLNHSGLMSELIDYYGASKNAQDHFIEGYVDEDNLNGYYYDVLQVYHQCKITPEAQLFFHCLMYQRALENDMATTTHLDFIQQFSDAMPVHNIPRGRSFAILMLEANDSAATIEDILNKTRSMFHTLDEICRISTALYMVKLLFIKRKHTLIEQVLLLAPDINETDKNIDDLANINQVKIYRAYSLFVKGEKVKAIEKLNEFDPLLVQAFMYNHIMNDYKTIYEMIKA